MSTLYERCLPDNFNVLLQLTWYPPHLDLHLKKVSNHGILIVPEEPKTPSNLTFTNVRQTESPFVLTYSISYPMLTSTLLTLQLPVYPTSHMTSSHTLLW